MRFTVLILIALFVFPAFAINQKTKYIGYKHKGITYGQSLPNGVKSLDGGLLTNENYGVSRFSKGKLQMLWLEKITERDTFGVPDWVVKDVLTFSNLKRNQQLMFSYSSPCKLNGKKNTDLIVKVEFFAKNHTYKVLDAWKTDLKKEKFTEIPTKGIICK